MILDLDFSKQGSQVSENQKVVPDLNNNGNIKEMKVFGQEIIQNTPLQQFYSHQTIFITGGTGFLGKVLIEKLLRCCPEISRIYVLIRHKRGKNIDERIHDLLGHSVFASIRNSMPTLGKKVIGILGDITLPRLGLCDSDVELLLKTVTIVFHVAATVRFDEKLKQAAFTNIQSTASIIELCKDMKHLKSLVHTSTAYANCFVSNIEEKFYDYSIKYEDILNLVKSLPDDTVDAITPQLINSWPNTYTFTKALAEDLIRTKNKSLPMGIFRPGIVISTANEPTPGWTDNYNGPMGVVAGVASGVLRTFHCDPELITNIVPVDLCVNAMIACASDIAEQTDRRDENMLIYNFTSTEEAPISWGNFGYSTTSYINQFPSEVACWYAILRLSKFKFISTLYALFLHWIPAYLVDLASRSVGQKPRLQKVYEKLQRLSNVVNPFTINEWNFKNTNVQNLWTRLDSRDQVMFQFTMQNFDWQSYIGQFVKGVRIHLLKEDLNTLESSKAKSNRFFWIHYSLLISLTFLACWSLYSMFSIFF